MHGKCGIKISKSVTGPQSSEGSVLKLSTWKRRARSNARMGQGLEEAGNRGKRILETTAESKSHTVEGSSRKKKQKLGVVLATSPTSVEAIEQPRRSQ